MGLKVYNGSSWSSQASAFKLYNGSAWVNINRGYVFDGSQWRQYWPEAPANIVSPTVTSTTGNNAGSIFSTTTGVWTNNPTSYTYQWQRGPTDNSSYSNIAGATSSSYTITTSDIGYSVRVVVTATNARGSTSVAAWLVQGSPISPAPITGLTASKTGSGSFFASWNSSLGAGANGATTLYRVTHEYGGNVVQIGTNSTSISVSGITSPNRQVSVAALFRWPGLLFLGDLEGSGQSVTIMNIYP